MGGVLPHRRVRGEPLILAPIRRPHTREWSLPLDVSHHCAYGACMRRITIPIPDEDYVRFRVACARVDASMGAVGRVLVQDWTTRMEGEPDERVEPDDGEAVGGAEAS